MKTSSIKSRFASVLLIITVIFTMSFAAAPAAFAADQLDAADQTLIVDAKAPVTVKGYNASYTYNTYISIRDVAAALNGTSRQFNVTYDEKEKMFNLEPGKAYEPVGGENACGDGISVDLSSAGWDLNINGKFVRYYIYEKGQDFYIKLVDLSLALGLNIEYVSTNQLKIDTAKDFIIDINQLDEDGYFSFLDGTILGNSTTGEILYESKADNKTAIASTTKLMTYLLVMEAIDAGKISMNDTVTISKAVEKESKSEDYVIPMTEGQKASMQDLLEGMLVPSSNECALALAEHVAGSEAEFVKLMNQKAKQLGLKTAVFYNPHGLPNYSASAVTSKRQNSMSARDMFTLASYVMKKYPKITEITSMEDISLTTLSYEDSNTNPLLYNTEGVVGLKTGTTNRAGCCLVSVLPIKVNGKTQNIIAVEFGAESSAERGEKSQILLQYAQQYYAAKADVNATKLKVSASAKKGSVTVSWNKNEKADGYQVYRSTKKASGFKSIKTTIKTSLKNTSVKKGSKYFYKVRAYKTVGGEKFYSSWSNVASVTAK